MSPEDKDKLERWKNDTLSVITAELAAKSEEFRSKSLADFNAFVEILGWKAHNGFVKAFGILSEDEFSAMPFELKDIYVSFLVAALNAALAIDHPYAVALVYSDKDPSLRSCVVDRKGIPGAHDLLNRDLVPVLVFKGCIGTGPHIRFWPLDVKYLGKGDNLENLYKL